MGDGDNRKNNDDDDERKPLLLSNGNLPNFSTTSGEPQRLPNQREADSSLYYNSVPPHPSTLTPTTPGRRYESIMRLGGAERPSLNSSLSGGPPLIVMSNFGSPAPDVEQPATTNGEAIGDGGDDQSDESSRALMMSHCHVTDRDDGENRKARRTLVLASILCLSVMIAEIIGGYIADSLAIMTDAAHLLTDFASFLISLFSLYVASRPATRRMSFGWHRAEVLGAFMSVLLIWIITGVLVYMAIERIVNKSYEIKAVPMLITAAVGVAVNIIMAILLQAGGHHGHSHGGGGGANGKRHQHQSRRGSSDSLIDNSVVTVEESGPDVEIIGRERKSRNINIRAAFIHVLGDFFQSVGVLIAAFVIFYHPEWKIVDPVCTFVFSILVLITTLAIMRDALNVLMEGSPRGIDFLEVADSLASLEGVVRVHNLRIWSLTMDKVALSVHLAVGDNVNSQDVLKIATNLLRNQFGVYECTIQIEHYSNDMEECAKCEHPKN